MERFTIKDNIDSLTCESDGKTLTYRWGDEPMYVEYTLRSVDSFTKFKNWVTNLYGRYADPHMAWDIINDSLQSDHMDEFVEGGGLMHCEPRSEDEIADYLSEAFDKVWLMRNCDISRHQPIHEASRPGMERILRTYSDIPKDGYTDWECGYWNGILGALRWVLQDEKDFLDT